MTMTMTMKYIYLNPTLYIQWMVNSACKLPKTFKLVNNSLIVIAH